MYPCQITYSTEMPKFNQLPSFTNFPPTLDSFVFGYSLPTPPFCFPWKYFILLSSDMCSVVGMAVYLHVTYMLTSISRLNIRHLEEIGKSHWPFLLASSRDFSEKKLALFLTKPV